MTRYKGRSSPKSIERDFPFIVEMLMPEGGLDKWLRETYAFHAQHYIQVQRGRCRRNEDGRDCIRWCFANPDMAIKFADQFGGAIGERH